MKFVYPAFLFALFSIAIPIIIHLFNFRKFKKVYFTNVRFLKEVKQETQSRSRLRHLLILISRILAITALVLAFAQPFIPADNAKTATGDKAVSIYIDNSFSMEALTTGGTLLDEAKKRAKEIATAYKATDRFQLLTNDFEGRHQRLVNKEELLELIDEVKISPSVRPLPEVLSRQFDVLGSSSARTKRSYLLSDFQESLADLEKVKNDTSITIQAIPLAAKEKKNVYIDSCWFTSPVRQLNHTEQLHVRIRNITSEDKENNPIKLFVNGKQRTPASYNVEANGETDVVLSFASKETGIQQCMIEINDYPVSFDDRFYFTFEVAKNIPVLAINGAQPAGMSAATQSTAVTSLFGNDSLFVLTNAPENNLDYSTLPQNRFIVLNGLKAISSGLAQELKRFVKSGGSVAVFPAPDIDLNSYRDFLGSMNVNTYEKLDTMNTKVDRINYEHELFTNVFEKKNDNIDLPSVSSHYPITKISRSNEEYLFRMRNGDAYLSGYRYEKGKVYLSAVPLDNEFSNFTKHALTITALYNMAVYSQPVRPLFYTIGRDNVISIPSSTASTGENVYHVKGANNFDVIPEHKVTESGTDIFVHEQVTLAGNYTLTRGSEVLAGVAFNYDRKESDLDTYEPSELLARAESAGLMNFSIVEPGHKELTSTLAELDQGKKLWKLCIILALVLLAVEVALLRMWR